MPCTTCKKRNHTHLCVYGRVPEATRQENRVISRTTKPSRNEFIVYVPDPTIASALVHEVEQAPDLLSNEEDIHHAASSPDPLDKLIPLLDHISLNLAESCETDKATKNTTYLGRNAAASLYRRLSAIHIYDLVPKDVSIESAFCLTNRTTLHPFGSLWVTVHVTLADVLSALPEVEECMRYYRSYQQNVRPFYPFLQDEEEFENRFCKFLRNLEESGLEAVSSSRLVDSTFNDAAWFGLLFAVLGSGCQYSDTHPKDRVLRTRVFVVCAFECLRLANLYVLPSEEVIQCMLFLELILANDCNPGVAQGLLGITVQQAQELGLHVKRKQQPGKNLSEIHPLWRAVIFIDSVLSSAYDRRPITFLPVGYDILCDPSHATASTFHEIMWAIHALKINWQKTSAEDPGAVKHIQAIEPYLISLEKLEEAAEKTFLTPKASTSVQGRLEELVYKMYLSCFKSKLARFACLSKCPKDAHRRSFFEHLNASLQDVVKNFLALKRLSPIATVSWDLVHRAMTASLLLAGMETVVGNQDSKEMLQKMTQALTSTGTAYDDEAEAMIMAPFRHALDTLRYLLERMSHEDS